MNAFFNLFSDDIQLHGKSSKPLLVHGSCTLGNKQLLDVWLRTQSAFAKTFGVCRHLAQMHQLQPFALHLFDDNAQDLLLTFVVFRQKHQTCTILAFLGYRDTLKQNKLVGNLQHDARTVTVLSYLSTTVAHILQYT